MTGGLTTSSLKVEFTAVDFLLNGWKTVVQCRYFFKNMKFFDSVLVLITKSKETLHSMHVLDFSAHIQNGFFLQLQIFMQFSLT